MNDNINPNDAGANPKGESENLPLENLNQPSDGDLKTLSSEAEKTAINNVVEIPDAPKLTDIAALVGRMTEPASSDDYAPPVKRGRGRPPKDNTSKPVGKDRSYREKAAETLPEVAPVMIVPPSASDAAAAMIVGTMDMIIMGITGGEYVAPDDMRENYKKAWADYLRTTGVTPPPWLMLAVMSGAYVLPVVNSQSAQSKWTKLTNRMKGWWVSRFGG